MSKTASIKAIAFRGLCCALCCFLLVTCLCSTTVSRHPTAKAEDSVSDLSDQKAALAEQEAALQAQRNESAQTLEEQEQQKDILDQQIQVKSQEIAVNQQLLDELDAQIAEKTTQIATQETRVEELTAQIAAEQEQLRVHLRAVSKSGSLSMQLQLLLDSTSYTDYLISSKLAQRISESSEQLMNTLEANIREIQSTTVQLESDKALLSERRTQVDSLQAETEAGKSALVSLYADADALAQQLSENVEYLDQQIAEIDAKQQKLDNQIDEILARLEAEEEQRRQEAAAAAGSGGSDSDSDDDDDDDDDNSGSYSGPDYSIQDGAMIWPAPGCNVITSSFKYRPQYGRWHYGTDIACYGDAEGMPIVAAADGQVVWVDWDEGGYGNYLMIDHGYDDYGRRIITVYAHCSSIVAYSGLTVSAGDLIAYVGNTGGSDGAHLHFEVRVDGDKVDSVANGYLSTSGIDILG